MSKDKNTRYDLYLEASKTAVNNAALLCEEADLLINIEHLARGFALCVLSLEESSKAYLFRYISLNLHNEAKTLKLIRNHEKKLHQTEIVLSISFNATQFLFEILKNMLEVIKDEQRLANLRNNFEREKFEQFGKAIETLKHIHGQKLDSLYVDIRDGKIIDPNRLITREQINPIFDLAELQIEVVKNVISMKDEMLSRVWNVMPISPFEDEHPKDFTEMMQEMVKFTSDIKEVTKALPDL